MLSRDNGFSSDLAEVPWRVHNLRLGESEGCHSRRDDTFRPLGRHARLPLISRVIATKAYTIGCSETRVGRGTDRSRILLVFFFDGAQCVRFPNPRPFEATIVLRKSSPPFLIYVWGISQVQARFSLRPSSREGGEATRFDDHSKGPPSRFKKKWTGRFFGRAR
jgi:hypothetical protein